MLSGIPPLLLLLLLLFPLLFCPIPPNRDNIDVMNLYKYATIKANIPYATAYIKKSIVYTVNVAIKKAPNIVPAVSSGLSRSFSNAIANIIVTIGKTNSNKV